MESVGHSIVGYGTYPDESGLYKTRESALLETFGYWLSPASKRDIPDSYVRSVVSILDIVIIIVISVPPWVVIWASG